MKTKTRNILAAATLLAGAMIAPCAMAAPIIVNVDFNGNNGSQAAAITYNGTGAAGGGTVFNGIAVGAGPVTVTGTNLLDSFGGNTTIDISFTNANGSNYNDPNQGGAHVLADDAFYNTDPSSFTLSGLTGATADLYFYGRLDGVLFPSIATIAGTSPSSFSSGIFNETGEPTWVLFFNDVTVTSGSITGTMDATSILGGMTIVDAVPEPSVASMLALLGIGFVMKGLRRRRHA